MTWSNEHLTAALHDFHHLTQKPSCDPVLNLLTNMATGNPRTGHHFDAICCILGWVDNNHFSGSSGFMPSPISFEAAMNLVVEAAAKDELSMQIRFGQGISKKDDLPGCTEYISAILPKLTKN